MGSLLESVSMIVCFREPPRMMHCLLYMLLVSMSHATHQCNRVLRVNESSPADTPFQNIIWSNAEDFIITKRLGSGTFGEAFRGKNVTSDEQYVIKLYKFGKMKRKKMLREIAIAQLLCGHPNIIRLYHVIRQSLFGYPALVFESVQNVDHRELYPKLSTSDIRYYAHELLKGIAYAHSKGIIHKDIKPDNVMIDHEFRVLKIIDWGISDYYKSGVAQNIAGSLHYKSPEMLMNYKYSSYSTDMWSYGCMLAAMLLRKTTMFEGSTERSQLHSIARVLGTKELIKYAHKYDLDFNVSIISRELSRFPWGSMTDALTNSTMSSDAADLLDRILVYDHRERITAQEALCHPYFSFLRNDTVCDSQHGLLINTTIDSVTVTSEHLQEINVRDIYSIYYKSTTEYTLLLCGCIFAVLVKSEEGCRIVARFRPTDPVNATVTNPGSTASKARNFDDVELFYSNADDFTITKRLGSGSYGEAYLGHNITSMQTYVVKLYRFGKLKRKKMMREILVTQSLCGSPNIIKLYHVIKQSLTGYPALVFEYARDTYYRDLYPKLSPNDVRYYIHETLKGLAFAHDRGVMHKDLKPANIMIDHEERKLKIIDWGLSQFYVKEESQSIAGSLYYKSPEMLLNYPYADYSTDIWSLGCVFAAMLYRRSIYFTGGTPTEQLLLIANTLGTDELLNYNQKYAMSFNVSEIGEYAAPRPWASLVTDESRAFATSDALDLLSHMLVFDHKLRISAKDALKHPYFRPLRQSTAQPTKATATATATQPPPALHRLKGGSEVRGPDVALHSGPAGNSNNNYNGDALRGSSRNADRAANGGLSAQQERDKNIKFNAARH